MSNTPFTLHENLFSRKLCHEEKSSSKIHEENLTKTFISKVINENFQLNTASNILKVSTKFSDDYRYRNSFFSFRNSIKIKISISFSDQTEFFYCMINFFLLFIQTEIEE